MIFPFTVIVKEEPKVVLVRGSAEKQVDNLLDDISEIRGLLATETTARTTGDQSLSTRITTEIANRTAANQQFSNDLAAERAARIAAITNLDNLKANKSQIPVAGTTPGTFMAGDDAAVRSAVQQIGNIASQVNGALADVADLETKFAELDAEALKEIGADSVGLANLTQEVRNALDAAKKSYDTSVYFAGLTGADVTGATDMRFFLQNTLNNLAAGTKLVFPPGRVALSGPIDIPNGVAIICPPRPKWLYKKTPAFAFVPHRVSGNISFTGAYMFGIREAVNGTDNTNSIYLENLVAMGSVTPGGADLPDVTGLLVEGEVFGITTKGCAFRNFQDGYWVKAVTASNSQSRGHKHEDMTVESCIRWGFHIDGNTDSIFDRCHAHFNGINYGDNIRAANPGVTYAETDVLAGGVYLRGMGDMKWINGFTTFNERGFVTGDATISGRPNGNGNLVANSTTDRSRFGGFEHRSHGTRTTNVVGCVFGRDGRVTSHNTSINNDNAAANVTPDNGTSYGVLVDGGASQAGPISFSGNSVQFGVDDSYPSGIDRNNHTSPAEGVRLGNCGHVSWNGGVIMGRFRPSSFGGNDSRVTRFHRDPATLLATGTVDAPVFHRRHAALRARHSFGPGSWTDMPAAETRYRNSAANYLLVDMNGMMQAKITAGVSVAGATNAVLWAEFTTDLDGTAGWTRLTESVNIGGNGYRGAKGAWRSLPIETQGECLVRITGSGGDGAIDPAFQSIDLHVQAYSL